MLRRQGVEFLSALAQGVPRNMIRGRTEKILARRSSDSRVLGLGAYLGYARYHRCALNTPAHEEGGLVRQMKPVDSVLACG